MQDTKGTPLFNEARDLFHRLRCPHTEQLSDGQGLNASPDGGFAVFTGFVADRADAGPSRRIFEANLGNGALRSLTGGASTSHSPRYSPDGALIAFLSDSALRQRFQLCLMDRASGAIEWMSDLPASAEYFEWSPCGKYILVGAAGTEADVAAGYGGVSHASSMLDAENWQPSVDAGISDNHWRRLWVIGLEDYSLRQLAPDGLNVWEASWCGSGKILVIASESPTEGSWYGAYLASIDTVDDRTTKLLQPLNQISLIRGSPEGDSAVFIHSICSDRGVFAGELCHIDLSSGAVGVLDTGGMDVSHAEWRDRKHILIGGHKDFLTIAGIHDLHKSSFEEVWRSEEITTSGFSFSIAGIGSKGDFAFFAEGFQQAPALAVVSAGTYQCVRSLDLWADHARSLGDVRAIRWNAPDGLEIQGWLLTPDSSDGPFPLITNIHGGPVGLSRPRWLGRNNVHLLMLLKRGYAIFFPNPRGSTGRGVEFAGLVRGDMGGAETQDHLSGIDFLIAEGLADPSCLGLMGGSHGGYMTSWLVTQDTRFAAGVSIAPAINFVTQNLMSNIPEFIDLFLHDTRSNLGGRYYQRSAIFQVDRARTPLLQICGALDKCTPPQEALQFHNAMLRNGTTSVLVTYPLEGHGIYGIPAYFDYCARIVSWFETHMPARMEQ